MKKRGRNRSFSLCNFLPKNNRGQVTIFIIIGIVIVSVVSIFFLIRAGIFPNVGEKLEENPNSFLESCLEDSVKEGIRIISSQGGYVNNQLNKTFKFSDEDDFSDISYLCYTNEDYNPCVNQEPMLIQHLKNEIKNYIFNDVEDCLDSLILSLENQGLNTEIVNNGFEIELEENKVNININSELTLTKTGETTKYENFKVIIPSKFYDMALVTGEIINKEVTNCDFNIYDAFDYPELDINKHITSDSSIIYRIIDRESGDKFKFAVRGCVISSGFGINVG